MHIKIIEELDDFVALRGNWDMVYDADPEAQFFLSWQWLFDWLTVYRTVWFVLAGKRDATDADYGAFLPIRMHTVFDKAHGFSNALYMAGAGFSDYTGILTRPEFEAEAVLAFAEHLKRKLNLGPVHHGQSHHVRPPAPIVSAPVRQDAFYPYGDRL